MRLAQIQMAVTADKAENLRHAEALLASVKGADMAVLPEMFCCPYDNGCFRAYGEAEGGEAYRMLSRAAVENGLWVHLFDIDVAGGQRFRESDTLTAGDAVTVFDTPWGRMGLCICFDLRFQELARLMTLEGAQVLVVPAAFNMTTGPAHWELLFRQRAVDEQVFTVGVSPARDEAASYVAWGHSIVCDPWGTVLHQCGAGEEVAVTELELEQVSAIRGQLPILSARRTDIYEIRKK